MSINPNDMNFNLNITFLGDLMLGREVGANYKLNNNPIVSNEIKDVMSHYVNYDFSIKKQEFIRFY